MSDKLLSQRLIELNFLSTSSPISMGTASATTPSPGDNSTLIATTAYVVDALSSVSGGGQPVVRSVYLVQDSSDQTILGGTANNIYTSFQTAYDAANTLQVALGGTNSVVINIDNISGTASSNLSITSNYNSNVILVGKGKTVSNLGNITATNAAGAGYSVILTAFNCKLGSITSSATSAAGDGGAVTINGDCVVGVIISNGASDGAGGTIVLESSELGIVTVASILTTGNGTGSGGVITLANGTIVLGTCGTIGGSTGNNGVVSITNKSTVSGLLSITNNSSSTGGSLTITNSTTSAITQTTSSTGNAGITTITQNCLITGNVLFTRSSSGLFNTQTFTDTVFTGNVTCTYTSTSSADETGTRTFTNCSLGNLVLTSNTASTMVFPNYTIIRCKLSAFSYTTRSIGANHLKTILLQNTTITGALTLISSVSTAVTLPTVNINNSTLGSFILNTPSIIGVIGDITSNNSNITTVTITGNYPAYIRSNTSSVDHLSLDSLATTSFFANNSTISIDSMSSGYFYNYNSVVTFNELSDTSAVSGTYFAYNGTTDIIMSSSDPTYTCSLQFLLFGGYLENTLIPHDGKAFIQSYNTVWLNQDNDGDNIILDHVLIDIDAPDYDNDATYNFGDYQKDGTITYMCQANNIVGSPAPSGNWVTIYDSSTTTLTLPYFFATVSKITITMSQGSTATITAIEGFPNLNDIYNIFNFNYAVNTFEVEFTSGIGKTVTYTSEAVGSASANELVCDTGTGSVDIIGRANGTDKIHFIKNGNLIQRSRLSKLT